MSSVRTVSQSRKLGSFEIVEEIGQGGMGVVYLARQPALERPVVLKKMRRDLTIDPSTVERFQREARAAAMVHHQNVVAVYDCFSIRGDHYIAEEYVDGPDLRSVLDEAGRLEPRVAALIALEVIRGVEEIHARGIVHRDLKPDNILIGTGGETKIADFGIALDGKAFGLTRPGMLMGSIPYLSPEQLLGERVDYRSDLFVFGILLYEMLTGKPPFEPPDDDTGETLLKQMQSARYVSPRARVPGVPRFLARVIRGCLHPKPARRAGTATAVRRQIERGLGKTSPADCRFQIATWLWERGLIRPVDGRTEMRPLDASAGVRTGGRRRGSAIAWLFVLGLVSLLIFVGFRGRAWETLSSSFAGERARAEDSPAASERPPAEPRDVAPIPDRPGVEGTAATEPAGARPAAESEATTPAAAPADPALVRFVVWPWAEVRIDGQESFVTPLAAPVSLDPGTHRVVFEHPTFGRAEYEIELEPGEHRTIRHVFDGAPRP